VHKNLYQAYVDLTPVKTDEVLIKKVTGSGQKNSWQYEGLHVHKQTQDKVWTTILLGTPHEETLHRACGPYVLFGKI
jgi:hypothetical protein